MTSLPKQNAATPRKRLKREDRRNLLLDLAANIIESKGADALTLQTLAETAGITKPVTYSQFGTREGLLLALYQRYDLRFFTDLKSGVDGIASPEVADIFTESYLNCVLRHGRVYEAVIAALRSYATHQNIRIQLREAFCQTLRQILPTGASHQEPTSTIQMIALFGAAEELGRALLEGQITIEETRQGIREAFNRSLNI